MISKKKYNNGFQTQKIKIFHQQLCLAQETYLLIDNFFANVIYRKKHTFLNKRTHKKVKECQNSIILRKKLEVKMTIIRKYPEKITIFGKTATLYKQRILFFFVTVSRY